MAEVRYETKSLKVLRGTEGRSITKWQGQGWELVNNDTGTARSTLTFRKAKRAVPVKALAFASAAVLAVAGVITGSVLLFGSESDQDDRASDTSRTTAQQSTTTPPSSSPEVPSAAPTTTAQVTAPAASTVPVADTTVDELLDRLNSAGMGGVEAGDLFRVTGELFESDAWGVGRGGEYTVFFAAKGGADDLMVFVDQADAAGWRNGTVVTMVVEAVEVTIDGQLLDGVLRAQSVAVSA